MSAAAQILPVRNEKDATGTHIGVPVSAQVVLVLAVATIVLFVVKIVTFMALIPGTPSKHQIKEKTTAMEIANGKEKKVVGQARVSSDVILNE